MKLSPRTSAILIVITAALVVAIVALEFPSYYAWQQQRMVKCVLTANPDELLSAGRELLGRRPGFVGQISTSSPDIPKTIRMLKPTYISISSNSVGVDFSDVFNPFGILVYAAGANPPVPEKYGRGPLQWIDGLWLYDDGQLESFRQHSSSNRTGLIRSEINQKVR